MRYFKTKGERIYLAFSIGFIFCFDFWWLTMERVNEEVIALLLFVTICPFVLYSIYRLLFIKEENQFSFSKKNKKIFARELLIVLISLILCTSAFCLGLLLDKFRRDKIEKFNLEIDNYEFQFRKNEKVNFELDRQLLAYSFYNEMNRYFDEYEINNYFFWKNIRKSIEDSTFHFTYGKKMESIYKYENHHFFYSEFREFLEQLHKDRLKEYDLKDCNHSIDYIEEFKLFAINNHYEKYLPISDWKKYQELNEERKKLVPQNYYDNKNDYSYNFLVYTIIFCLIFMGLRYIFLLLRWSLKVIKSKEELN